MSSLPPKAPDGARDPRPRPREAADENLSAFRPAVAAAAPGGRLGLIIAVSILLGLLTFLELNAHRRAAQKPSAPAVAGATEPLAPPPPEIVQTEAAAKAPPPAPAPAPAARTAPPPPAPAPSLDAAALGRKAPTLVVDLGEVQPPPTAAAAGPVKSPASAQEGGSLNADEKFAERVSTAEPEKSRATVIRNTRETIPQGVLIPGVLETALNSDLPGFTRAVISRDVRGFDGTTVLIPRGSRVIGQYKSAAAQGQSRAFVIWTRIIRPDGASIQIASSGTDALGRAGLDGKVDRHFFEQFSGAILLTVLDAGVTALANQPSTQVVIGSNAGVTGLGAAAQTATPIPPTIKVPQGSPIQIFVARDLDFSTVGPPR